MTTDEQLIEDIRRGSRASFELLFERYRQPVWQFFRRRTARAEIAEELAQDTFVAVLEGASRYQARGSFRSYLFGIAYNLLQGSRRQASQRATDPLDAGWPDRGSRDPEPGIWVRDALGRLEDDERELLMLREYEQLSYQEIADVRSLPLNTVRSQLFRARAALRVALDAQAPHVMRTTHAGH